MAKRIEKVFMVIKELEEIVKNEREKGMRDDYIRNALKEYLQVYVLSFVYTSAVYSKKLIFTGGTCLRHFYNLERLSEDIDFDYLTDLDAKMLADEIYDYFYKKYKYPDVKISLKQKEQQILVKFPVLKVLGLEYSGGSDLLYVKMDLSPAPSKNFNTILSSQSKYGFNYVARHYDLPDLMAGKIHAVLTRRFLKGENNKMSVKGRDYFDLLWFIKQKVKPNIGRLSDMLGEEVLVEDVRSRLTEKVKDLDRRLADFRTDIEPLVRNKEAIALYVDNYQQEYFRSIKDVEW